MSGPGVLGRAPALSVGPWHAVSGPALCVGPPRSNASGGDPTGGPPAQVLR